MLDCVTLDASNTIYHMSAKLKAEQQVRGGDVRQ